MKHRLLLNPVKWLRGARKRHAADLYDASAYNPQTLQSNPFARALDATRMDILGKRFPLGNMIQTIVEQRGGKYEIVPVLEKPVLGVNPASYVLNRASYIAFAQKRVFLPIPSKRRQRDKKLLGQTRVIEDFIGVYRRLLEEAIRPLLDSVEGGDGPGMTVLPGNGPTKWENGTPHMYSPLFDKEVHLPYEENQQLCQLLLKHAQFCDCAPTASQ